MRKLAAIFLSAAFAVSPALAGSYAPLVLKAGKTQQAQSSDTVKIPNITGSTQCVHADTSGNLTGTSNDCGSGAGTVTSSGYTSGSPLAKFSTSTNITPAASGTDYAPATSGSSFLQGNGSGGFSNTTVQRSFGTTFGDTGGSALTSGSVVYFTVPYACTISAWNITVDAGTVTFDIWKVATGTAIPTVSNTITASAKPALSTGTALHSTSMSGWTTSVTANDIFGIQLNTVATAKYAEIDLECDQ